MPASRHSIFISYRVRDSSHAVDRLDERLKQAFGKDAVFRDVRGIPKGQPFSTEIDNALQSASVGLVVIGAHWLEQDGETGNRRIDDADDWVRREVETLLGRQTEAGAPIPVISVLLVGERPPAADDLPESIRDLAGRNAQNLRPGPDFESSVRQFVTHIAGVLNVEPQPFDSGIHGDSTTPFDISRIVKYAPPELIGREQETTLLDKMLAQMKLGTKVRPRVLTFVALGGEGKTSLVAKWVDGLDRKDWPGCEAAFAWSFYSQGSREQVAVSSDLFLAKALEFFGDAEMAASAQGAFEKGQRLASLVGDRKSVLVLDGLEPLQFPPSSATPGKLKDQGIEALLCGLARHSAGLCVVTTRFEIADVKSWPETAPQHELLRLSMQAGVEVLQSIGVKGSLTPGSGTSFNSKPLNEYEALVEDVDGHALTLQILGQYLVRAHRGDIRRRDRIDFATAEAKIPGGPGFHADHAFRTIAAYEAWLADDSEESRRELAVLRLLGLFDRPATADCVQALLKAPAIDGLTDPLVDLPDEDWEFTLTTLSDARLVSVNRAEGTGELLSLDAHPLIREYFAERMKDEGGRMKENDSTFRLQLSAFNFPPSSFRLHPWPPSAVRTPLRDDEGRRPAHARRFAAALSGRRAWMSRRAVPRVLHRRLHAANHAGRRKLQHIQPGCDRGRLRRTSLLLRQSVEFDFPKAGRHLAVKHVERGGVQTSSVGPPD
jgi:hypothetical protein